MKQKSKSIDTYTEGLNIYLVGGAVRDQVLEVKPRERDWVVVGSTDAELLKRGFLQVAKAFPVFLHPVTKEEYALARKERCVGDNHTDFVCETDAVSLEEDLRRRDLTINAMAQGKDGGVIDPFNGLDDLLNGVLRHVSDAFAEDPLRIFRTARFAGTLSHRTQRRFIIHSSTMLFLRRMVMCNQHANIAKERITAEFVKALQNKGTGTMLEVLSNIGTISFNSPINKTQIDNIPHLTCDIQLALLQYLCPAVMSFILPTRLSKRAYAALSLANPRLHEEYITEWLNKAKIRELDAFANSIIDAMVWLNPTIFRDNHVLKKIVKALRKYKIDQNKILECPSHLRSSVIKTHNLSVVRSCLLEGKD